MSAINPGDLVECVNDAGLPDRQKSHIHVGGKYKVRSVYPFRSGKTAIDVVCDVQSEGHVYPAKCSYYESRFVKVAAEPPTKKRAIVRVHALSIERSTERKLSERAHHGICRCGRWSESFSTLKELRREYRIHLSDARS